MADAFLYDAFPGLPVLAVDDWSEVGGWSASILESEYERLSAAVDVTPYLRFDYWADLIHRSRAESPC